MVAGTVIETVSVDVADSIVDIDFDSDIDNTVIDNVVIYNSDAVDIASYCVFCLLFMLLL